MKTKFPSTAVQDLRNYGSSRNIRCANAAGQGSTGAPVEMARLAMEEPRSVTVTISYSEPYSTAGNDTRIAVTFGTGQSNQTVEVREGVHTFPAQNIVITAKRYDVFNAIVPHPDNFVTVFIQITDDPPSWVLYDEVP